MALQVVYYLKSGHASIPLLYKIRQLLLALPILHYKHIVIGMHER